MKKIIVLIMFFSCSGRTAKEPNKPRVDTLKVVTEEAALRLNSERLTQIIFVGEPETENEFYVDEATTLAVYTSQLTDYIYKVTNIENAEIDTSEIANNILTITPKDTSFKFDIYRDFSERPAILSYTRYEEGLDSVVTGHYQQTGINQVGIVKLSAQKRE